jgi:thiol-disulfide isomerase/thioredoxin
VTRFVDLGERANRAWRAGDLAAAEQAFQGQIEIFGPNPEPFVSLALIEAGRGASERAMERLRAAVVRGFRDLRRVERAESWIGMPSSTKWQDLVEATVVIERIERDWPAWDDFSVPQLPESVSFIERRHAELAAQIDSLAPAIGPRLSVMWKRMIDRGAAALLDAYVSKRPDAPDLGRALESLMALYSGGPLRRWQKLPPEVAARLDAVAAPLLERPIDDPLRPLALVGRALARNSQRDKRGRLDPATVQLITRWLNEVVERYPASPHVRVALVGLVRTESEAGNGERAGARYREFRSSHASDDALLASVQSELGELGLRLAGLPDFRVEMLGGGQLDAGALRGKVVVLDFWATWCRPCVDEFPLLRKLHDRHADDVLLVGVSLDSSDELAPDALREWIAAQDLPGVQVYDGLGWDSQLARALGVTEIPFTVVLDPEGQVVAVNRRGKELESVVRAALRP